MTNLSIYRWTSAGDHHGPIRSNAQKNRMLNRKIMSTMRINGRPVIAMTEMKFF